MDLNTIVDKFGAMGVSCTNCGGTAGAHGICTLCGWPMPEVSA